MMEYILEQVAVVNTLKNLKVEYNLFSDSKMIVTASGSSFNAGLLALDLLGLKKDSVLIVDPFTLRNDTDYLVDSKNIIIGLSQTGRSISTLECLKDAKRNGLRTVSFTSGVENPIAETAEFAYDIHCGDEPIGPKTKGVLATSLALGDFLAFQKGEPSITSTINMDDARLQDVVNRTIEWCEENRSWAQTPAISMLGFSTDDTLCKEGALKILETLQIPIMTYPAEEFMHGPHRTIKEGSRLIVVDTNEASHEMMKRFVDFSRSHGAEVLYLSSFDDSEKLKLKSQNHWLEVMVILQVISATLPTYVGINPSDPVYPEFATTVGTRL